MTSEPMSDERLAEIAARARDGILLPKQSSAETLTRVFMAMQDRSMLLAEVERLRTALAAGEAHA